LPVASIVGATVLAAGYGALLGIFLIFALDFGVVSVILSATSLGACLPLIWLRDHAERREREVFRALPFLLDVLTLALEAGSNLGAALAIAVDRLHPGALRDEMGHVLQDLRAGRPRTEAFAALADRIHLPAIASLVAALQIAERQGASLGSVLRAQAQASRATRWLRAERQAMQAPVRMMLPLTVCIFPGTFAVLLFPVAMRLMQEGFGR
jgi:tight adherence protein C